MLAAVAACCAAFFATAANADVIYNSIPTPQPGNLESWGFQAYQTSEFGGAVKFAGSAREAGQVSVYMSSWACQHGGVYEDDCISTPGATFNEPITLKVYDAGATGEGGTPGALVASVTQTFAIPYRPSFEEVHCPSKEQWYDASSETCFHGYGFVITFSLTGTILPNEAAVTLQYNTEGYGPSPYHAEGPYNSLNIGQLDEEELGPTVGTNPAPGLMYLNSSSEGWYCNHSLVSTLALTELESCGEKTELPIKVTAAGAPTSVETQAPLNVTNSSATLYGIANPNSSNTTCVFEYGKTAGYGSSVPCNGQSGAVEHDVGFTAPVTGLEPGTSYDYRVVAKNAYGVRDGQNVSFRTTGSPPTAPVVNGVTPVAGPEAGGTTVTIRGAGFSGVTAVHFGSATASFTVNSSESITATSPAGSGTVDVTVTNGLGTSGTSVADHFTYTAKSPSVTSISPVKGPAGTVVLVYGSGFEGEPAVRFGAVNASAVKVVSPTEIEATAPASKGRVYVTVQTAGGTSLPNKAARFKYTRAARAVRSRH